MFKRIIVIGIGLSLLPFASVQADEAGGEDIVVPPRARPAQAPAPAPAPVIVEKAVSAPPPAWVELERLSVAAGIGISWGDGTVTFAGKPYGFSVRGLSVGALGASKLYAVGGVRNLDRIEDFPGAYMSVEAGFAAGAGASAITMRNEHGVVITLRSELLGTQFKLGPEGIRITLN